MIVNYPNVVWVGTMTGTSLRVFEITQINWAGNRLRHIFYNSAMIYVSENVEGSQLYPRVWKPYLYTLQKKAPRPKKISADNIVTPHPSYFGAEYHGSLSHQQAMKLLKDEGDYLVRRSRNDEFSLSFRVNSSVHHFILFYDAQYYVTESRKFDTLEDLVADGLLCHYMNAHAGNYILAMPTTVTYESTPHATLHRTNFYKTNVASDKIHHQFKVQTLKGLNWCDWCGNFLWGLRNQGVQCTDCGLVAHQKCSEKFPANCASTKKCRIFGVALTVLVDDRSVPFIVRKCIEEIERRGLETEGLYRMSGYKDEIASLKEAFEKDGEKTDLSSNTYDNIHVITGVLKQYLRLLPLPLIPYDVHGQLFKAIKLPTLGETVRSIREILRSIPKVHFNTLKCLIAHLSRVVECHQHTRMTALNMATVVNQTIMPLQDTDSLLNLGKFEETALPYWKNRFSSMTKVKHHWAWLVHGWVAAADLHVMLL